MLLCANLIFIDIACDCFIIQSFHYLVYSFFFSFEIDDSLVIYGILLL